MSILGIIVLIVVIGFALWLLNFIPMDPKFKQIAFGVIIFVVILYVLTSVLPGALGAHVFGGHLR